MAVKRTQGGARDMAGKVTGRAAACRDELIRLNAAYRARTSEDYYLYTSIPGDGQVRAVFTDTVCQGYPAGLAHMKLREPRQESM